MRLLLLTIDFPPGRGGVQHVLASLASGLAPSWQVTVVAPGAAGDVAWDRAQPYAVLRSRPSRPGPPALAGLQARALVELLRRRPRIIVCGHVLLGPGLSRGERAAARALRRHRVRLRDPGAAHAD